MLQVRDIAVKAEQYFHTYLFYVMFFVSCVSYYYIRSETFYGTEQFDLLQLVILFYSNIFFP